MYTESFTYHTPNSLDEALSLLQEHGDDAKLLAGGHSLLPTMKLRLASPAHLIDMRKLRGNLQYIREDGDTIAIGALVTHHMIETSVLIGAKAALLAQTAEWIGDMQIRNVGTLGGSIAHADPAADYPAAILALEAEMVVQGANGTRTIPASEFFRGFFETAVEPGKILTEIRIPSTQGKRSSYQKFAHPASGYAVCGVAVVLGGSGDTLSGVRVGITGVSDAAYRASGVEEGLEGQAFSADLIAQAAERAADGIDPLEDPFANAEYRVQLAKVLTKRALMAAWEGQG